ncbi:hypothetical protein ACLEYT_23765 [Escherichia coli]
MLSIFKTGQAADSVPAEKIQVTYRRYRMQALLSADESPNDFGKNH